MRSVKSNNRMRKNKINNMVYTYEIVSKAIFPTSINSMYATYTMHTDLKSIMSYKTFYRNIIDMADKKIITIKKVSGKSQGVKYIIEKINYKKLTKSIIDLKKLS